MLQFRTLCLLSSCSITWAKHPPFLCFSYFLPGLASDYDLPDNYAFWIAGIIGLYQYAKFFCWDGILFTFCLDQPQTMIFLISASQAAGIARVSNHAWPLVKMSSAMSLFLISCLQNGVFITYLREILWRLNKKMHESAQHINCDHMQWFL
jgi:hypothetical protein